MWLRNREVWAHAVEYKLSLTGCFTGGATLLVFLFSELQGIRDLSSRNLFPLQWKHRILITGPPGKCLYGILVSGEWADFSWDRCRCVVSVGSGLISPGTGAGVWCQWGVGWFLLGQAQVCGRPQHRRSPSARGPPPPSWIECCVRCFCARPWSWGVGTAVWFWEYYSEGRRARPLHASPCERVKETNHKGEKKVRLFYYQIPFFSQNHLYSPSLYFPYTGQVMSS